MTTAPVGDPAALARIRLRHLQCFLAVARLGTLQRAADSLALSQPAVTKTLNELEAMLGARLFERGRRGAALTPPAHEFMRHAEASVAALGRALASVGEGARAAAPLLRLGVLPTVAPALVPPLLPAFRAAWPRATLRVLTAPNAELIAGLRGREIDLAVGRLADPAAMAGLSFEGLYAEPLVVVARPGHPLSGTQAVAPAEVAACPLLLPPAGTLIRHSADSLLGAQGIVPALGITETLSLSLAREWLLASDALWFTPLSAVEANLARGTLARLALDTTGSDEPVGLLLAADSERSATAQTLIELLRARGALRRKAALSPLP